MKLDFRQRLLATTLLVGASVVATPAFAQDAAPQPATPEAAPAPATAPAAPADTGSDIVVTGTRIPQPNLESVAPVTVVSSQDLKLQGTTKVEDLLNSLPSVFASQASTLSNGSDGTATVDLRGLGAKRTLVLVNGRRLGPGTVGSAGPADINIIPSAIVKRVDVLTGGASSTYGADAVSGVVNFIMDTNFEGIRFDGQYSVYQHNNRNQKLGVPNGGTMYDILNARINAGLNGYGYPKNSVVDGGTFDGTVSIGAGFDDGRGHVTTYFGYRKVKPILQSRRDFSACTIQNTASGNAQCGGSATNEAGTVFYYVTGTSSVYNLAGDTNGIGPRYNFAPTNYFQRNDERYTAGLFANYEISPAIKPYLEFMFMNDRTTAQIAPSGDFGNTLTINCDNPLMTANQLANICASPNLINGFLGTFPLAAGAPFNPNGGNAPIDFANTVPGAANATYNKGFFQLLRRNVEGGPRESDLEHTTFRGVFGVKGDLGKAWSYDASYQYGKVNYNQTYRNEFSAARLARALDVVTDPITGAPACRSKLDGTDPNCVPYNVFVPGGVTQAAVDYLSATGLQRGHTSEQIANVSVTGLLGEYGLKSPWAEEGIAVNVGAEYRKESLQLDVDNSFATGDLTGQGAPTLPISGSFNVKEVFGEVQVPIIQKSFIDNLTFSAGYRRSSYETSGGGSYKTDTYKLGLEFAPIRDVRFRASLNRAVRAPNIQELFATQFVGLDGSNDPCADFNIAATDYGCRAQGMAVGARTPANPAGQYNGLLGGNPNLLPEVAKTKTVGVILQPRFLPRFALTVDWFDIKVKGAIQGFGADTILDACMAGSNASNYSTGGAPICSLIHRDASGSLWLTSNGYVNDLPANVGGLSTRGWEFNSNYSYKWEGIGTFSASMVGTLLNKLTTDTGLTNPDGTAILVPCRGLYGPSCGSPAPKWRHKARLSYNSPDGVGLSLQWRHIGSVKPDTGGTTNPGSSIKAYDYFDLAATATIGDHYNFRLGVNNMFDKLPPLTSSGSVSIPGSNYCPTGPCNGNTWPATYDALGRYLYAGVTLDF